MNWRWALIASVFLGSPAAADDRRPRQPTAPWVVDFAAAQCVAHRNYGTKERPLLLVLKAPPLGNILQLAVSRAVR